MEKNEGKVTVVCDAGPVIHLDEMDSIDLLFDFERILVPDIVWEEISYYRPLFFKKYTEHFENIEVFEREDIELEALILAFGLHKGEQKALFLMKETKNAILLTDDSAARIVALQSGMKVHGTIGIIIRAIRRKQKTFKEVIDILKAIPDKSSLHIKSDLLKRIIGQLESYQ